MAYKSQKFANQIEALFYSFGLGFVHNDEEVNGSEEQERFILINYVAVSMFKALLDKKLYALLMNYY